MKTVVIENSNAYLHPDWMPEFCRKRHEVHAEAADRVLARAREGAKRHGSNLIDSRIGKKVATP